MIVASSLMVVRYFGIVRMAIVVQMAQSARMEDPAAVILRILEHWFLARRPLVSVMVDTQDSFVRYPQGGPVLKRHGAMDLGKNLRTAENPLLPAKHA